ncbi:MAG: hypothetical protein AB9861_01770 [Methanosarcina sp.]
MSGALEHCKLGTWEASKITRHIIADPLLNDSLSARAPSITGQPGQLTNRLLGGGTGDM